MSLSAAERRKNVATAEGRGSCDSGQHEPAKRERFSGLCVSPLKTTAFSRGYILSPLRGFGKTLSKKQEGTACYTSPSTKSTKNASLGLFLCFLRPFVCFLCSVPVLLGKAHSLRSSLTSGNHPV